MKFPFPSRYRLLAALSLSLLTALPAHAAAPGGFLESDETSVVRPMLTASQIAAFMPAGRGNFTFPTPYNTQGVRITQPSDCGGQDCIDMTYNYWRNMSNSTGSNTMYILVGLDQSRGGAGPTLFSYDKPSGTLTDMGALFPSSSSYSWDSTEGMYFSYGMPTKIYLLSGTQLLRYDVLAHTFETVFDVSSQYPNTVLHQANSSNDDDVHSATLEDSTSYNALGCVAYKASTQQYFYFPVQGNFDECQIDKSGRYLEIKEKLPSDPCASCDEDDVIEDLQTGNQTVLYDQAGAGGHSDLGYGTMVAADNWNNDANAWRLWDLSAPFPTAQGQGGATHLLNGLSQGGLVYHDLSWSVFSPSHVSWENAVPTTTTPVNQQYACGSGVNSNITPRSNELMCFMLDSSVAPASEQVLVVAPVMTDLNATGGNATCPSCTDYAKDPKGNLDPTGQYFFWTANLDGSRLDAFIVKVPYQLLTGTSNSNAPSVIITSPQNGSAVPADGSVTVTASAVADSGITSVTFELDDGVRTATVMQAPYTATWDIQGLASGAHTVTALATDGAGVSVTSASVAITVGSGSGNGGGSGSGGSSGSGSSSGGSTAASGGGGGGALSFAGLLLLGLGAGRRRKEGKP